MRMEKKREETRVGCQQLVVLSSSRLSSVGERANANVSLSRDVGLDLGNSSCIWTRLG